MSEISEEKLLMFNQIGLIPGPKEAQDSFLKRVNYGLHLKNQLPEELKTTLLNEKGHHPEILIPATERLKKLYDCAPSWTPLFFSGYKLPFWNGGCAWIFQMTEDSPTSALIQLQQTFRNSATYLGIYQREELLAHELSHVGRMMFQEPKFEELLAYRTATMSYRRWLGPMMQSSTESALFLLSLFLLIIFDVFLLTLNNPKVYFFSLSLKTIPIAMVLAALIRLWNRQKTYKTCIHNLEKCVSIDKAEAVAYRLQDEEIVLFSKSSSQAIKAYATLKMKEELRWQVIFKAYFI